MRGNIMFKSEQMLEIDNQDFTPWNDFEYNQDFDKEFYNGLLLESPILVEGAIDSNRWILHVELSSTNCYLDFNKFEFMAQKWNFVYDLVLVVKCWAISLLEQNRLPTTIQTRIRHLEEFLHLTHGGNSKQIESFMQVLEEKSEKASQEFCTSIRNFFSFVPSAGVIEYIEVLSKVQNRTVTSYKNRPLPNFADIKIFHTVLMDYVEKIEIGSQDYLRFYPIYLWWQLTTIIPLRPSEFCSIKRNGLIIEKNKYYLQLPRMKQKNNRRRIQVVDKILISKQLAENIEAYIEVTERYGKTETLLSYRAYASHPLHFTFEKKINPNRFSSNNFAVLLESFYYHVIQNKYKYDVKDYNTLLYIQKSNQLKMNSDCMGTILRRVRPGDTRHFAMMNLLRQGYHIVEMARIAGHTSLYAQNPYQQHDDLYYDFELIKIADFLGAKSNVQKQRESSSMIKNVRLMMGKVDITPMGGYQDKLDVGYCTDELKRCPSHFSKLHIHCPYWRIGQEEFLERKDEIAKELTESQSNINRMLQTLINLHTVALKEYFDSCDYLEDNVIYRSEINKWNRNITSEMQRYDNAICNLSESGVLTGE